MSEMAEKIIGIACKISNHKPRMGCQCFDTFFQKLNSSQGFEEIAEHQALFDKWGKSGLQRRIIFSERDGKVQGFALVCRQDKKYTQSLGHTKQPVALHFLYTSSGKRGRGVATRLVQYLQKKHEMYCMTNNPGVLRICSRVGFRNVDWPGTGVAELLSYP